MPNTNICKERFINGKLVSRVCVWGDLFFMKNDFPTPEYNLSVVTLPDQCPVYPSSDSDISEEKVKEIAKVIVDEEINNHVHNWNHHH